MGEQIGREEFTEADYRDFRDRLERCLEALGYLLRRPGFGVGPSTLGAELELALVGPEGRPAPCNERVRRELDDPRVTLELNRFNLECNLPPIALAGSAFSRLERFIADACGQLDGAAARHGAGVVAVGILPTLERRDLESSAMSSVARYRALSARIRALREAPFALHIEGAESLRAHSTDITVEGANTSFQLHLRVAPEDFTNLYNAFQVATAPVLAVAGNSPFFLGRRLWEETRIALFKQAVDFRPAIDGYRRGRARVSFGREWLRGGALELFYESARLHEPLLPLLGDESDPVARVHAGAVPDLAELRLHQGTVWRWNRPVYDPGAGGHLRIEMRTLPAGPSARDMVANAAFLLGLGLGLAERAGDWPGQVEFEVVHRNFYRAAQCGLEADLEWPFQGPPGQGVQRAATLVPELLGLAEQGLCAAGAAAAEVQELLAVIRERVRSGQTGAAWQAAAVARLERTAERPAALTAMLELYRAHQRTGAPVHTWPLPTA